MVAGRSKPEPSGSPPENPRALKQNQVKFRPRGFKDARFVVPFKGYQGESTALGAELISEVSQAQGKQANPIYLYLVDHEKNVGDIAGIPTMEDSDSSLELAWEDKGSTAKANFAHVFALKRIEIPEGTKMIIELYEDVDSHYGPCVGMRLSSATFEPIKKGKPRAKKADKAKETAPAESKPVPEAATKEKPAEKKE